MYRVGYIDDEPTEFEIYRRSLQRRCKELELVLIDDCESKQDILDRIYEKQIDVLLIDYKMVKSYGFNGTTLIHYINDSMRDIQCFILTAVDTEQITDGLVAKRDKYSKNIFDTEAADPQKEAALKDFIQILLESAKVFQVRRQQKLERYRELLDKKGQGELGADEEEFLELYKVLSSYGMVEKLPKNMLDSKFEERLQRILELGDTIIAEHKRCNLSKSDKWPTEDIAQPHNGECGFVDPADSEFDEHLERNEKGYVIGKTSVGTSMCNMLHLDIRRTDLYWKAAQLRMQLKKLEELFQEGRLTESQKDIYIETNIFFNEYIDQAFIKGE